MKDKINELKETLNEMIGNSDTPYNEILEISQELDQHIVDYYEKELLVKVV